MKALPKILLVPTTYQYTGNPFTEVVGAYTTSDFVSGTVTLADPLAPNTALTSVSPTAFTFSDGVQTFTNLSPSVDFSFTFATGPTGAIILWNVHVGTSPSTTLLTVQDGNNEPLDAVRISFNDRGANFSAPGQWTMLSTGTVADTGSTLSLMTLTLMALGVAA